MNDPTKIDLTMTNERDPRVKRLHGMTHHGHIRIDVPVITLVEGNLWQGGCENGLILPDDIRYLVSLYKWESYEYDSLDADPVVIEAFDSLDQDPKEFIELARLTKGFADKGPTLVHCQAGLNRSGVVAALVLVMNGYSPEEAIEKLRESRSPAVLCNPSFEEFVLNVDVDEVRSAV